ncbi:hypothetical protein [Actinacidiphila acididurans]|uniref:Uncharacterized protein n=1 Tax=Actinacidiphila acididurans TaxID=2784346 RepID=A0ABS2TP78_9ACTN|nr:hypothetical protein [Actinacidiphila acididurans]MBM9504811.1 hypothetical protein [Actinacidiphila acididurans]
MSTDQQFEDRLPDALRLAADEFPPPAADLVRSATARGSGGPVPRRPAPLRR